MTQKRGNHGIKCFRLRSVLKASDASGEMSGGSLKSTCRIGLPRHGMLCCLHIAKLLACVSRSADFLLFVVERHSVSASTAFECYEIAETGDVHAFPHSIRSLDVCVLLHVFNSIQATISQCNPIIKEPTKFASPAISASRNMETLYVNRITIIGFPFEP